VDVQKGDAIGGLGRDFLLEVIEGGPVRAKLRTDDLARRLVRNPENEPGARSAFEVGFVAQGREVLTLLANPDSC